ncbi:MAG TPA: cytochrome P450, partial [Methylibium sp.]|uniref:cytochrome P450 n=1 Tax=Methylibium sp. TaxID=2067992 RepID=UPI002DB5F350
MTSRSAEAGGSRPLPRAAGWDASLAFRADPYRYIARQCAALGSDVFETRLLLVPTLCMSGARAAELFYDEARFCRAGAAPRALQATLFGCGGVQGLDDAAHRHRKALFLRITAAERAERLLHGVRREWEAALHDWTQAGSLSLFDAVQPVLTRAVCDWAGVPVPEPQLRQRSDQLAALFDGAAGSPARHLGARWSRKRAEAWLAGLIEAARSRRTRLPNGSAAQVIAEHREPNGELLPARIAAVELLNVLRPTVAVSVYIAFVAHALQAHPQWKPVLAEDAESADALAFVQEVRRHYPFFPAVAARVREDFEWQGHAFVRGRRALFDLYGSNHDARLWNEPDRFAPQRWQQRRPTPWDLVPQGGADAARQHRCPGEDIALRLMLLAAQMLTRRLRYEAHAQSAQIDMRRLPALPWRGFLMER